mmetsp:Transcript_42218/g.49061  ORF Transcript_42218/g.49061 Transcript_42218/m.49061 type:complete len:287 (-) Transcript_42218:11704-12564(-)
MIGSVLSEFLYTSSNLTGLVSMNSFRMFCSTNSMQENMILSGLKQRRMIIFLSLSSHLVSHSAGNGAFSGIGDMYHLCHSFGECVIDAERPVKTSGICLSSSVMLSQAAAVIQAACGFGGWSARSSTVPPRKKNDQSSCVMPASAILSLTHICSDSKSLCLSNSDMQAFLYTDKVCSFMMLWIRSWNGLSLLEMIESLNSFLYQLSENWYIGSILFKSERTKNKALACLPQGLKASRASSIRFMVCSADSSDCLTSSDVFLELSSVLTSSISSIRDTLLVESMLRI